MEEERKRFKMVPAEEQPTAETLTSYFGPNKMGFDVCWTLPSLNMAESVQKFHPLTCCDGDWNDSNYVPGRLESPPFDALCWKNWTIGAYHVYYERRQQSYWDARGVGGVRFNFALNLVDDDKTDPDKVMMDGDPLFDTPGVRLDISMFDKNTKNRWGEEKGEKLLLSKQIMCHYEPLRTLLGKTIATLEIEKDTELWNHLHGALKKPLKMLFELRVMTGGSGGGSNGAENVSVRKKQMSALEKMAQNLKNSLDTGKFSDFTIRTGDGREIRAHRVVLMAASPYFEAMFGMEGGKEARDGEMSVPESHAVISEIVRFLYTGRLPPPNEAEKREAKVIDLFVAADKYQITALKEHYEPIVNSSLFSIESVCDRFVDAHQNGGEEGGKGWMKAKAVDFIRAHRWAVPETEGWRRLLRDHPALVVALIGTPPSN